MCAYTKDANALDAATALDKIARATGHKGFAVLTRDNGKSFEIHPVGGAKGELKHEEPKENDEDIDEPRDEGEGSGGENSFNQMGGAAWERAKARSHKHGKRVAENEGRNYSAQITGDAAHARRMALSAEARRATAFARDRAESVNARNCAFWAGRGAR